MRTETVGDLIRDWRRRRRMSQLDLSLEVEVSTRHLSFVESGRASAGRALLQRLGDHLAMPLRDRNRLLVAGGYAPLYSAHDLRSPELQTARETVDIVLRAHAPYPALAVDRLWNLVAANGPAENLMAGMPERLTAAPMNVLRATLDPDGLAPRIVNLSEWRHHILSRLRADFSASADPALAALHDELAAMPYAPVERAPSAVEVAVPLVLRAPDGALLSFLSTTMVFGAANDVTLAEITIESFFPADDATRVLLTQANR